MVVKMHDDEHEDCSLHLKSRERRQMILMT